MTVCAVVVTYNRLNLLKECIDSLRVQTRKLDEILVINNSSTDGTLEWLNEQKDLTVITQPNSGGAGGFHTGIKTAYEKGHDWIWCMDDDCITNREALNNLLNCDKFSEENVYSSVVLSKENNNRLAFPLLDNYTHMVYNSLSDIQFPKIYGANFFNGVLLSKQIIGKIGLPRKDMFVRGDEIEFYLRIIKKNISIFTVVQSIIFHPEEKYLFVKFFNKQIRIIDMSTNKQCYYIINMIRLREHYSYKNILKYVMGYFIFKLKCERYF